MVRHWLTHEKRQEISIGVSPVYKGRVIDTSKYLRKTNNSYFVCVLQYFDMFGFDRSCITLFFL